MAEEVATLPELEGFDQHLERLSLTYSRRGPQVDSRSFCTEFCELVGRFCRGPGGAAAQLRVLEVALCYFLRASSFLPPRCDHVQHTLSSLALSVFELLLFLDQKDFSEDALPHLALTFQESPLTLARHPNVYLLQLHSLIQDGGPWGNQALLALLCEQEVPQSQVDLFLASEPPLFQELRVRYLLSVGRGREAAALAGRCAAAHPSSRQRPFLLQVHLAWLCKTEQKEQLHREVSVLDGALLLQVICAMEPQEDRAVLLRLCRAVLRHLLHTGHMQCLRQLVCVWGVLHRQQQTSTLELLEESRLLLQSATHCTAIFPFIRVLLQELGDTGLQFCVELCSRALGSGLVSDSSTRSLVHKVVASLLPQDLEVCRACALLVFFQERSLEAYRTVVRLYCLPDQEYHAEATPVGNHVRFDLLQVLKKDMVFDPEFWNVVAIRSNCQKLLSGEALRAAQEEVSEVSHCPKKTAVCPLAHKPLPQNAMDPHQTKAKKRHENGMVPKRSCRGSAQSLGNSSLTKKRHTPRTQSPRDSEECLRRSFWQPSRTNDRLSSAHGEQRRITRFSEKNRPKRKIRTPRWLLEDSGTMEMNAHRKVKKLRRKVEAREKEQQKDQEKARTLVKRSSSALPKTIPKEKRIVKSDVAEKQSTTRHLKGLSLDYLQPTSPAHVILEFSLPDNELSAIFTDDTEDGSKNGVHQYQATAKVPCRPLSHKSVHPKRVVIRASDEVSLARQLHCYARCSKQSPPSVVTRSSSQALPTKGRPRLPHSKPLVEMKVTIASQAPARTRASQSQLSDEGHAKAPSAASPQLGNKSSLIAQRSLAPGYRGMKTDQKPSTNTFVGTQRSAAVHNSKHSVENLGHEIGDTTINIGGVSDSITDALAKDSQTTVHIAGNDDVGRHHLEDVTGCVVHGVVTGRASDTHGSHVEEDLHGLRLLSETVSALTPAAPQSIPEASGEAMEEQSLPAQQSPKLWNNPDASHKILALSSPPGMEKSACSLSKPAAVDKLVKGSEAWGDQSPMQPESEDSCLEYRCTLCHKLFRGKRVLVHAMFHCRRDQCMFCGVLLKDDLLAMMHLSEHIDNLKKLRESEHNRSASESLPPSKRLQMTCPPPARGQRRPRKSITTPAVPDTAPSESRRLRSDSSVAKGSVTRPKVNGHIKRRRSQASAAPPLFTDQQGQPLPEDQKDKRLKMDNGPSKSPRLQQTTKRLEVVSTETRCPVLGCPWQAELSRSPLALLYHALEEHHRDNVPLELAFQLGKGQCSVCLRVLWSFQHYRHHVERHRLTPRHPCLHQGCGARFRTGIEMRRHSRKHRPLQASCCIPGCSELFICLWALNLHEREHYAGKDTKSSKACLTNKPANLKTEQVQPAHAVRTPMRGKDRLSVRDQTPRRGQTIDRPTSPDSHVEPCSEFTTGHLVKGSSMLRRSQDSTQVEDVQVRVISQADSQSAVSHKLRKTPFRQQAKQVNSVSPSNLVAHSRRRRRLENRQVKLNIICKKSMNHHRSKTATVKKCFSKPNHGHFVEEEHYQKCNMVSTSQEHSAPMTCTEQEQSAPLVSPEQEPPAPLVSTEQEQSAPLVSPEQELPAPLVSTEQEQSAPLVSPEQEPPAPLVSTEQEQSAPLVSPEQEPPAPLVSTEQEQSAPLVSPEQEQSAPTTSKEQEQSAPLVSPEQEQSAPTISTAQELPAPLVSTEQELPAPLVSPEQEQSAPLVSTEQEQSAPTTSKEQEQSAPLVSTEQELPAPLVSTEQEQSAPLVSTEQEQSAPLVSPEHEQSAPLVSPEQEQSAPTTSKEQELPAPLVSPEQEQSAPTTSKEQEQSAPLVSPEQEQSAPLVSPEHKQSAPLVSPEQEQSAPLVSTEQEQSAPLVSPEQEQSAPLVSTEQEQSAPLVSTEQEQSAPLVSTEQEQSAPTTSKEQEQSAPLVSPEQEQSAPTTSKEQEQSAPLVSPEQEPPAPLVSKEQEQSAPLVSPEQEQSHLLASTKQERLNKTKVSKKRKPIPAAPSNSDGNVVKKGRVAHLKKGPKSTKRTTCNTTKSNCRSPSKMKGLSVAQATKGLPVVTAPKGPLITTEATAVTKTTEVPQGAIVAPTSEMKQRGGGGGRVGYSVLVNGAVSGKRKAADAPGQAQPQETPTPSYRRTYFRVPPTTYLDERFTNMPKRRKHMSMFRSPPKSLAPEPRPGTRCPSCFVSFSRGEDLQEHLRDKRCASKFGFDSDEDNS